MYTLKILNNYQGFNLYFCWLSHLSTKPVSLVWLCLVSVTEMPWPSKAQLMVGGGLPLATHFRERDGPETIQVSSDTIRFPLVLCVRYLILLCRKLPTFS